MVCWRVSDVADLFSVTAPLLIRLADGSRAVIAECFPHPQGILYFDLFWHGGDPAETIHLIAGEITGAGPWKIGASVVRVLGCQGTDAELADAWAQWSLYLNDCAEEYPPRALIYAIARGRGAISA